MFHKRLMKEFRDNLKYVAGMTAAQWVSLLANIALVYTIAQYLGGVLKGTLTGRETVTLIAVLGAVVLVRAAMAYWENRMSFAASSNVKRRLRNMVLAKLMRLGTGYREHIATSEAVQFGTEGVEQLEIYFGKYVPQFFYSLLAPVTLFVVVGSISMKVGVVLFLCVPLIPVSIVAVQKFAKKLLRKYWGSYTGLGDTFLENLQGLTTLKIYQADQRYAEKMDKDAEAFRKATMRVLIMQLNSISIMDLVAYGGAAAGIILGLLELTNGSITFDQCFFIVMVSAEFFLPLRLLGSFFHIAMNGNEAANKIFALMDVPEITQPVCEEDVSGGIQFSDVSFRYGEGTRVLNHMNFHIQPRSFTALAGMSGCGKSTVASLIMGEHRSFEGKITIGDRDIRDIPEQAIYQNITRIGHDSYLFGRTVEENLRMGKEDASVSELNEVLKRVDLYDTLAEKGGLSMKLTEKASNLSGGQKQRLALARAILRDSDIYIFDEATSNVDVESENRIMEVIQELAFTKTVILISHRLANVRNADCILMLEDGSVTEQGTHRKLCQQNGRYRRLYLSQKELEKYAKGEEEAWKTEEAV